MADENDEDRQHLSRVRAQVAAYQERDQRLRAEHTSRPGEVTDLEARLRNLDAQAHMCFGRIDYTDGRFYIGPTVIEDEAGGDPLVISYDAPRARPFYDLREADIGWVLERRHFTFDDNGQLRDVRIETVGPGGQGKIAIDDPLLATRAAR